jgi:hypothetical protein
MVAAMATFFIAAFFTVFLPFFILLGIDVKNLNSKF